MSNDYKVDWPLSNELLIELGRLSALWSSLEAALNFSIGKLAGFDELSDPIPFILTVHSSFQQRLDILCALCEQRLRNFPYLKEYKDVASKIKAAQALRNKFIHNGISLNPITQGFELSQGSARQTLKTSTVKITSVDIHNACKQVHIASLALHELITTVKYSPIWER